MTRLLLFAVLAAGCNGGDGTGDKTDACVLFEENAACPECADGDVTCTYGEYSLTAMSCGGCQARSGLYQELCDAGITDTKADIEAGVVCEDADSGS